MRHCDKCLENNWRFEKIDNMIRATCNICGSEVEFGCRIRIRKSTPKVKTELIKPKNRTVCRKCGGELVLGEMRKPSKVFKNFHKCVNCRTVYFNKIV